MKITDVRVRIINKEKLKASVSVTFDECYVVHDIKVIQGNEDLFVSMPSRKTVDGQYKDIAHPINTETRNMLISAVLEAYKAELEKQQKEEA